MVEGYFGGVEYGDEEKDKDKDKSQPQGLRFVFIILFIAIFNAPKFQQRNARPLAPKMPPIPDHLPDTPSPASHRCSSV